MLEFRINTFLEVYDRGSITRAAETLCLTQPAVSTQIKDLEERIGQPLFVRTGRQLEPTPAARTLYRWAIRARSGAEETLKRIHDESGIPRLRIGATRTLGEYLLPDILAAWLRAHRDAELSVSVDNTRSLLAALEQGRLDLALIEGPFKRSDWDSNLLWQDRFIPLACPANPLTTGTRSLQDLLGERLLVRESGSGSRRILESRLEALHLGLGSFRHVVELGNIETMKQLCIRGTGIAFLYAASVRRELETGLLAEIPLADFSVLHDYTFVTMSGVPRSGAVTDFLALCVNRPVGSQA